MRDGLPVTANQRLVFLNHAPDFDTAGVRGVAQQCNAAAVKALDAAGWTVQPDIPDAEFDGAVVRIARSKAWTQHMIAQAAAAAPLVVVDGQKTDGIDTHFKLIKARCGVLGTITKAHGRIFWFQSCDLSDWLAGPLSPAPGFQTHVGLFSAEKIDPGSALLADRLPEQLGPRVADLGAGWGFLSKHILAKSGVQHLDCVEIDHRAAACCGANLNDPRATVHWADATTWSGRYDDIVMNPPFHVGRAAASDLGKAFIAAAARCLTKKGNLWLVANRHLPYESDLKEKFRSVQELPGDNRFKVLRACL